MQNKNNTKQLHKRNINESRNDRTKAVLIVLCGIIIIIPLLYKLMQYSILASDSETKCRKSNRIYIISFLLSKTNFTYIYYI